jgi:hypothetical protein
MRVLPALLLLPLLALPAHAQPASPQPTAPPATPGSQAAPAPASASPAPTTADSTATSAPAKAASREHHRLTWKERFAEANVAHDGHLTLAEAKAGYKSLVRHFNEIDADKKGYVTEEDITNWHKLQRAMHHANHGTTEQGLRPRPAMQQGVITPQPLHTSTSTRLLPMAQPDTASATGQQATTTTQQ